MKYPETPEIIGENDTKYEYKIHKQLIKPQQIKKILNKSEKN